MAPMQDICHPFAKCLLFPLNNIFCTQMQNVFLILMEMECKNANILQIEMQSVKLALKPFAETTLQTY